MVEVQEPLSKVSDGGLYKFSVDVRIENSAPFFEFPPGNVQVHLEDPSLGVDSWELPVIHDEDGSQLSAILVKLGVNSSWLIFD